ncbi:capsular exopolysaccharide family [Pricia antarctica]|uniref:non-specific protein-tyrosine kinase n=2 Tax=Pricia antarctica TaxID=641691 RepID=A0A1G6YPU3_9FLAO|nr:capsular exopolysaccharide family [Pricia antarctica]
MFILSICSAVAIAFIYIKLATPIYEASTSILIDSSGRNRVLGDSKYVEGGVSLIEMEKNLYNEIGIIKSFSIVRQTVEELGFDVSYYAGNWLKKREHYGYFPFEVTLTKTEPQLYGIPFEVSILSQDKYKLTVEGDKFSVANPATGTTREVNKDFSFSKEYNFGEQVSNDHFTFILKRPAYNISVQDFEGDKLSFYINSLDAIANNYLNKLEVNNIDLQASIFKIVSSGPVVEKEIDFLQKLTENYVQNELASRSKIASTKESFIQNQLRIASDSLTKFELKLETFKKDKSAINLGATATNAMSQTSNLLSEKSKIELDINYYNSLIKEIQANRNSEDFVMATAVGIEDPLINENILELKRLYTERSRKKFFVTSSNQEMSILNKQINESTELLLNNLRNAIKSSEYALQRANSRLSNFSGVMSSLPTRENQLLNIQRQSTLYENMFNYLSQELAKAGIARSESTSDTRVLDEARMMGKEPIAPQKMLLIALAMTFGILVPLAWIVVFSPKDTIENVEQIIQHTEIPVIASIVRYDTQKRAHSDVALWTFKESFRDLITNLKLINSVGKGVIGITSITPGEGKSYTTINLGITLAESGKRTLIIDVDLRKPSLVKDFRKVEGKGLSNYLRGDINSSKDIIYPHEKLANLSFIPTSVMQGNVHESLSGPKLKLLIEELKDNYDYIILDTPAAGLVSDFLLLGDFIDINLFVIRRKIAKIRFLDDIEKLIPQRKHKKNFIVFNDALKKNHKYGYEQKYGHNRDSQLVNKSLSV